MTRMNRMRVRLAATIAGFVGLTIAASIVGCATSDAGSNARVSTTPAASPGQPGTYFIPAPDYRALRDLAGNAGFDPAQRLPGEPAPVVGDAAAGFDPNGAYSSVAEIDLNSVLQQAQGGQGRTPFVPSSDGRFEPGFQSRRTKVPLLGDIPQIGALFHDAEAAPEPAPAADSIPAEFTLRPGEELWVIERSPRRHEARGPASDDYPGSGSMMTRLACDQTRDVPVPLAHTDVHGSISSSIASVEVTQRFINPYSEKIEALYVFPLPEDAAVNDFLMTIGSRTIRGVIREREEAQRVYEQARARGYHASLLNQERSNIFTQHVANIEPAETIDITMKYFHSVAYRGGEGGGAFEFVFPMTIGPRFNPPCSRNGVAPVANGTYGSGQQTTVPYLRPNERSGHDVSLTLDIDAGMTIEKIESPSHQVDVQTDRSRPGLARVALSSGDSIPNRDFVLRYRVAGGECRGGMVTHVDERGGFFTLTIVPPSDLKYIQRGAVEMVFVIDCSGSMDGAPLAQAKSAAIAAIQQLRPCDTFQVVRFSDDANAMADRPLEATGYNIQRGLSYVAGLQSGGGTMMITPMRNVLRMSSDWRGGRRRFVCFLTDGFVGNEAEVLGELKDKLGETRIFSVGIGTAPNRTLLTSMARLGRGVAAFLNIGEDPREVMDVFVDRVTSAAMTDLRIDWGGLEVTDVYPKRLPDLYADKPIVVTGKFRGSGSTAIKITGKAGERGERIPIIVQCDASGSGGRAPGLPLVWARQKIADLDDRSASAGSGAQAAGWNSKQGEIKDVALRYGLVSAYTSFVAVDSSERTAGSYGTTVAVPSMVPQGVRYETTVGSER